jgi:S1-C subfamily serine protease
MARVVYRASLSAFVFLLACCVSAAHPSRAQLRAELAQTVAMLSTSDPESRPRCAGVRVVQGILTAAHCTLATELATPFALEDGSVAHGGLIRIDRVHDLALYSDPFPPGVRAQVRHWRPELDEPITAIGMPSGVRHVVHHGHVTSRNRPDGYTMIRAGITPGFSGGPVFDARGEIVGIVSRRLLEWGFAPRASEELGQMTPCDAIRRFLRS